MGENMPVPARVVVAVTRFRVQPHATPSPRWRCRQCLERWSDAPGYLMWRDGLRYAEALTALGMTDTALPPAQHPFPPDDSLPPCATWQTAASRFVAATQRALWSSPLGDQARAYLHRRGLTDTTIRCAGLGFNAGGRQSPSAHWGLDRLPQDAAVWLPHGIVIPWVVHGTIWKLTIRRPGGRPRYVTVRGSSNVLYNVDALQLGSVAVLMEGCFDALAVDQAAGDLVVAVASGTTGARRVSAITRLAMCSEVLIALDNEEDRNPAVAQAIAYWLEVLHPRARRWRPYLNDAAEMLKQGMDVRVWVRAGLAVRRAA